MTFHDAVGQARERRLLLERAEQLRATFDPARDRELVEAFLQLDAAIEVANERVAAGENQRQALTDLANVVDLLNGTGRARDVARA